MMFSTSTSGMIAIMEEVHRRWPGKLHFTFPNGLRGDILDEEVLDALKLGGTYAMGSPLRPPRPGCKSWSENIWILTRPSR